MESSTKELAQPLGNLIIIKWVKLNKYCELTGDTVNAVHAKRRKGEWLDGIHCKIAPDGNLWINLSEVERWVENGRIATLQKLSKLQQE